MANLFKSIGFLVLGIGIVIYLGSYLILDFTDEQVKTSVHPLLFRIVAIALTLLVLGYVLSFFQRAGGMLNRSKCVRCGKPIPKGRIYCFDHQQQVVEQYREKLEDLGAKAEKRAKI